MSEVPPDIANLREANAAAPSVHLPSDEAGETQAHEAAATAPASRRAAARAPSPSAARRCGPGQPYRSGDAPPAPPRCTSVGPFRELAQAATAAATLRTAGYQPTQRVAEGDIWIGYWVYIDAIPTEAEANAILAKVRGEGITDSYVIPNSDSGNLVSLGVFSEISGVSRRREQVRALGYEPKVVDRTRRATVYWVDVVLTARPDARLRRAADAGPHHASRAAQLRRAVRAEHRVRGSGFLRLREPARSTARGRGRAVGMARVSAMFSRPSNNETHAECASHQHQNVKELQT